MQTKYCNRCGEEKSTDAFLTIKSGKRAGKLHTYCRKCCSRRVMSIEARNPERRKQRQRDWWAANPTASIRAHMRRYGSDEHYYFAKLSEQNEVCGICGNKETRSGTRLDKKPHRLSLDHCHKSGANRGLLCNSCNTKLAAIENEDWLSKAETYLAKYHP